MTVRATHHPHWRAPGSVRAFILSGGQARRAGGINKSLIEVEGRPIIEHQLQRLRPAFGDRITVVTDRPKDYEAWGFAEGPRDGLCCAGDLRLTEGPPVRSSLLGIASALALHPSRWCFLLAGDMPWPDIDIVQKQWEWVERHGKKDGEYGGVCLMREDEIEPFHAIIHGRLTGSAIDAIRSGDLSVIEWMKHEHERRACIKPFSASGLGVSRERLDHCLVNINYPPET